MKKYDFLYLVALLSGISACSDDLITDNDLAPGLRQEIRLQAEIDQLNLSRADDSGFADDDRIGIYAVDFSATGTPGDLNAVGNHADNVAFTFDASTNTWNGARQLYFKDEVTPVDFYGYYPYIPDIADVNAIPFSVKSNQSKEDGGMSGYEASDFLWGKRAGVTPSDGIVSITFKHIMAAVEVTLEEGVGFEAGEWSALDKHVIVSGTRLNASVDISDGSVTVDGDGKNEGIIMAGYKDSYRAIVVPQPVGAGNPLLSVTVDGQTYKYSKEENLMYQQGKMHKFVIKVSKLLPKGDYEFSLIDEAVTAWESDLLSHDGFAKEYIVVNNPEKGGFQSVIDSMKLDPSEIVNLKITGVMSDDDFRYLRGAMNRLEAVNLSDVITVVTSRWTPDHYDYLPDSAFFNMGSLRSCVFPKKLQVIGARSFQNTSLTGSLDIPEGITEIGNEAFGNWNYSNNLTGTLTLPSTLKTIGSGAFYGCDFTGELFLPEGLEIIGVRAFRYCRHFTGELRIPESVVWIGDQAFADMDGITGWVVFPKYLDIVRGLGENNINGIIWPDHPTTIGEEAFANLKSRIDIVIPETVEFLGKKCFYKAKIRHVTLPPNLTHIPERCFYRCSELSDTLTIPENVEFIDKNAFDECGNIQALVLPAKLRSISEFAFGCCRSLQYIRCDAKEPPVLSEDVFNGFEKDNFTVEVPEGSVDAYRNAPGWCEFKRIAAYKNFVARPSKYNVLNKGGKKEIVLNADDAWEMTECPSWCHVDKTSGEKKTVITLTVDEMAKGSATRNGKVEFKLKGDNEYSTHINVGQYDYVYDEDEPLTLQKATKGNGVDLVFIGDGYDAADISSGVYLEDMRQEMEYLFGVEPYTTYRDYFNVYTAFALSEDSGVESVSQWRNTKFDVCLGDNHNQRLSTDWSAALDYCAKTFPCTVERPDPRVGCVLVSNTDIYEGVTYSIGESFCAVVTKSTAGYPLDARGIVQHEAGGHGIGWLGDEYVNHMTHFKNCPCGCCGHVDELLAQQASGHALNLSLNGQHKEVPWQHLIFNPSYQDIVDVYEGGYFHKRGVYRSEINSCMNNNVPYFSTWSRQLIVQRIMKLAGETFSLESFYANDSRAKGSDFSSTSRAGSAYAGGMPVHHGNPPVIITDYKYGKKGGRR